MDRWYTSDSHYGHFNIIAYAGRPFTTADEMDAFLLERWNETVKPQDHVSHLGDVTLQRGNKAYQDKFIRWMKLHNGHKRLYLGNHDHFPTQTYLDAGFEKIYGTWRSEESVLWSHIPIHPQSLGSAIANVHGHIHQNAAYPPHRFTTAAGVKVVKPYINICVEATDYRPIHIDEIMTIIRAARGLTHRPPIG